MTKLRRMYGNTKMTTLQFKLKIHQQELKATTEKMRYQKRLNERKFINKKFHTNPKVIYRQFKGESIKIMDPPAKEEIGDFWKGIWCEEKEFNSEAEWLRQLESEYCNDIDTKEYNITIDIMSHTISKLQNSKAPGSYLIVGYWYKHLTFYRENLAKLYQKSLKNVEGLPHWLCLAKTHLLPKSKETHLAKNYRPIACLNLMYKLFTSCLNVFIQDHCERNSIVTTEQAGGKQKVWGCTEHLLINKMIMEEVITNRRNLCTVWLDYQKAFDSIPHSLLFKALHLAKIPLELIKSIQRLSENWTTNLNISSENGNIETNTIKFARGIFQGDSLSVILFILAVNPLSFLLQKCKGYCIGTSVKRTDKITHLFFVDDHKLYATNINVLKLQLDLVTKFSKDIGMTFGESKCAYEIIERGKLKRCSENLVMNRLNIRPLTDGECYKYLGQDENLSYDGPINKERVTKEYYHRVSKIWSSELSAYNKYISHNAFAVPVLMPTFGILKWSKDDLKQIDLKTRKILTNTGNFHINGDIDHLYIPRKSGGKGLKKIVTAYESRIILLTNHLTVNRNNNPYLTKVAEHEMNQVIRVGNELLQQANIDKDPYQTKPSEIAGLYKEFCNQKSTENYHEKVMHGYMAKKIASDNEIDHKASLSWGKDKFVTSHFEKLCPCYKTSGNLH